MVSLLLSGIANVSAYQEIPNLMKANREFPWDGVERRKRERRNDALRKCCNCNSYFPAIDGLNLCPDCVRKMLILYKQGNALPVKL